jgi:hypothetical protein
MRAQYFTYRHIRIFILGVPEGWQVALFDLQRREWIGLGCSSHGTLKEARLHASEKVAEIVGKRLIKIKWH